MLNLFKVTNKNSTVGSSSCVCNVSFKKFEHILLMLLVLLFLKIYLSEPLQCSHIKQIEQKIMWKASWLTELHCNLKQRLPLSASHQGLSGIHKNPMNIINDGKPAKPSIYLKEKIQIFHNMELSATIMIKLKIWVKVRRVKNYDQQNISSNGQA